MVAVPYAATTRLILTGMARRDNMAGRCEICGKSAVVGGTVARRGVPKKKGGIGRKTTGRTKRRFKPNIQRVRVKVGSSVRRMNVCTKCITSGRIEKA